MHCTLYILQYHSRITTFIFQHHFSRCTPLLTSTATTWAATPPRYAPKILDLWGRFWINSKDSYTVECWHLTGFTTLCCGARPPARLIFPLCATYADEGVQISCTHTDSERCQEEVYTSAELAKAVSLCYEVRDL